MQEPQALGATHAAAATVPFHDEAVGAVHAGRPCRRLDHRVGTDRRRWTACSSPGGVAGQTKQVVENLAAQLATVGATLADVVKTTCFLTDMDTFATFNDAYVEGFGDHRPARSTIGVAALPGGAAVEIEAWAYNPHERSRLPPCPVSSIIVVVLLLFPVLVALGTTAIAAVLGQLLYKDGEKRNEGSELARH